MFVGTFKMFFKELTFVLIAVLVLSRARNSEEDDDEDNDNSFEDDEPIHCTLPFQVLLEKSNEHVCAGSILNSKLILTAASCVYKAKAGSFDVLAGILDEDSPPIRKKVERIIVPKKYRRGKLGNDIAVLKLKDTLEIENRTLFAVSLPSSDVREGKPSLIFRHGWNVLRNRKAVCPIAHTTDNKICSQSVGRIASDSFCTYNDFNFGLCESNYGGPVIDIDASERERRFIQTGIISKGSAGDGFLDIHTNVFRHIDWVKKYLKRYS